MITLKQYLVETRRYLHKNPEIGFELSKTRAFIKEELTRFGIKVIEVQGSLVGILEKGPGKVIALRSDMDALPIKEENDVDYKSNNSFMHACGHDCHMAMLLGAASILKDTPFNGTIKFIFQAAEEGPYPGGAKPLIDSGVLDDVKAFFGLHIFNFLDSGTIGLCRDGAFAAPDAFKIIINGKSCHGAYPDKGISPIVIASSIILRLEDLRCKQKQNNAVISLGMVNSGRVFNVIPDQAIIEGSFRTFTDKTRQEIIDSIDKISKDTAEEYKGSASFNLGVGYPILYNDDQIFEKCLKIVRENNFKYLYCKPNLVGEDFARYRNIAPIFMASIGGRNEEKGCIYENHNSKFNIDESSLEVGANFHVKIALELLRG